MTATSVAPSQPQWCNSCDNSVAVVATPMFQQLQCHSQLLWWMIWKTTTSHLSHINCPTKAIGRDINCRQLWQSVHGQLLWPMWDGRCDVRDWHPQSTSHINRPAKAIDRDSCDDSADCCGDCNVAAVAISVMANCLDRRRHSRWGHTGFGWLLRGARPRPRPRGMIVWSEIDRLICSFCCCYCLFNSLW